MDDETTNEQDLPPRQSPTGQPLHFGEDAGQAAQALPDVTEPEDVIVVATEPVGEPEGAARRPGAQGEQVMATAKRGAPAGATGPEPGKPDAAVRAAIQRDQAETEDKRAALAALREREAKRRAAAAARLEAGE